ncbi:YggT family protein [Liquorilactobacillus capillatus]|uniref:YggT family protein n=1 Tax=Liquorilactobacillus capillatus DSM 19910 TaxID=1423731 RepID=A0A0R1M8K3_9LACO|nr:YggT family protein [Liquorilactobacillus capillatus]KRL01413.1 hypothetical protein FC81_GL001558 [Liquorilactobacillus capillatus DSM 19910]
MIITIFDRLFELYSLAIVAFVLMSWFPGAYQTKLGQFLGRICQPYLGFFDRFIPPIGGISFSPIVALVALQFIKYGFDVVLMMVLNLLVITF